VSEPCRDPAAELPPDAAGAERLNTTLTVAVPGTAEQTRCRVEVWAPADGGPPVAILSELPDNPGLSVTAAFPYVAQQVRALLPADLPEPMWIEHWPERAVAAVLLERPGPGTDTLVMGERGLVRAPLPPGSVDRYLHGTG
jgi:hypothetical protein